MFVSAHLELVKDANALVLHQASTQCEPLGVGTPQEFHEASGFCLAALKADLLSGVH
jgi:hypothetical protein